MTGLSIRGLIDKRALETPEATYLIDPATGQTINYRDLKIAVTTVASRIAGEGIKPGESVAYAMGNGADAALVVLGILYGGYLATAVNLVSGSKTIAYVVEHSQTNLVFCQTSTLPTLRDAIGSAPHLKIIEVDSALFNAGPTELSDEGPRADSHGLLMYTSGTTGVPKGVLLTHGNLIAGGKNTADAHQLTSEDRGLCVLPLYHINGLCVTIMGALISGGAVIVPPKFSVSRFWDTLLEWKGSWFSVVPTQISYLLLEAETNGNPVKNPTLRFGRSASAPLAPEVHRQFEECFDVPIVETMGLTETAAQILSNPLPPGLRKTGSPGVAIGNEIIIADDSQTEKPRGEEGEILVRGPNVMQGYLKNADATSDTLTSDGWLRTGDLGRMDEDGYVFVTGRLKELIIKGGENIAPREIDDVLYSHADIVEAAAFAMPCKQYGQRVEAGVMVKAGASVTEDELIELCREQVGQFKAPNRVYFFPELPKGPSGKIQRLKVAELAESEL